MTARYLLDTNMLAEPMRPIPRTAVIERIAAHETELATAAPVWFELHHGASLMPGSKRRDQLERYLDDLVVRVLPILPYDDRAARWHAGEAARLRSIGKTAPLIDGQIASIAVTNDLILITANVEDFAPFRGLMIENWTV